MNQQHDLCAKCRTPIHGAHTEDGEVIELEAVTKVYKFDPKTQKAVEVSSATGNRLVLADHLPRCTEMQRLHAQVIALQDRVAALKEKADKYDAGEVSEETIPEEVFAAQQQDAAAAQESGAASHAEPQTQSEWDWAD